MRRALLTLAALAAYALLAASCLSPTLPLPPPDAPAAIAPSTGGLWQISGNCTAGAIVSIFDTVTGRGQLYEDKANLGTYHVAISGAACDGAWVQEETVEGTSPQTFFVLEAFANGLPVDPNACP